MRHPKQATLALHAGGDLGPLARWWTERHLAKCESCREEVVAFDEMRQVLPEIAGMPEIPWNRLAAEIQANVRLGLEAGECVRTAERPWREARLFTGGRAAVAFASMIFLVAAGMILQQPSPVVVHADGPRVQASGDGIQVQDGEHMLGLMNGGAQRDRVTHTMGASGSMGARYTDPETGLVTINTVYVE